MATHRQRSIIKTELRRYGKSEMLDRMRGRPQHTLETNSRYVRWLSRIPTPKAEQVACVILPKSECRMYRHWSRDMDHEPSAEVLMYITRRSTEDPMRHSAHGWQTHNCNVRAFRRVLWQACDEAHRPDEMSEYYSLGYQDPWRFERARFQKLLSRLSLHYSDIADALDKETDIIGAHAGMGVAPYTHTLRCWFDEVMGISHE